MRKTMFLALFASLLTCRAETFWGPGSLTIGTNEAILISVMEADGGSPRLYVDATELWVQPSSMGYFRRNNAIAGPRTISASNQTVFTYQRIAGSAIRSFVTTFDCTTNVINVPTNKTIQFFAVLYMAVYGDCERPGSTNRYTLPLCNASVGHAFSGPLRITVRNCYPDVISYYFTDDIVQLPPHGFLNVPARSLEINVEKSTTLTNWAPTATFSTTAETNAFFRLRILQ